MKAYKAFNDDMTCRGFQYEVGKSYDTDKAELCASGFHTCDYPLDLFSYYPPSSRFAEVEIEDSTEPEKGADTKRASKHIEIKAEIGLPGLVKAAVDFIFEKVDWKNAKESNNKARSAATNTGDMSAATNTGDMSAATNTGYMSAATNTGYMSAATVEGRDSIAMATGIEGKAKGALGCYIVLAEWRKDKEYNWHLKTVKSAKVDGKKIKANTFYMLKDGKFVEVKEGDNE